ncbi:hypothetical protein RRG08_040806 [Elysia crispata]|uniref:Paraoxonase n=1 Tax=Elysia crispata TaxID=231223 RepID=A0AAE1A110_9GAST|nr:hypothetical protein RRG08_040806 [Elysia crispata]
MLSQALLVASVAIACYAVYQFSNTLGLNGNYYNHRPGICRRVAGVEHGSEDIQVMSDGKAFITSGYGTSSILKYLKKHNVKGRILLFDFKDPSAGAVELEMQTGQGFDENKFLPHGLSVLEDKERGEHLVYVISHPHGLPDLVEKFRFSPLSKQLIHLRSIPLGGNLGITNDLALVAEDQFYITIMAVFHFLPLLAIVETFLPLRTGSVFFYNGTEMQKIIPSLNNPNGVFLSPDHSLLYVNSFLDKTLQVYRLQPLTNSAELLQTVQLFGRGDNVQLTQAGDALLIGSHPKFLLFLEHYLALTPADVNSPSSVVRLPLDEEYLVREEDMTEMFYDHGDLISGSSCAAIFDGQMLIGSVMDSLVHCELFVQAKR